jgi:hypothetical protein
VSDVAKECPGCRHQVWVLPVVRLARPAMFDPATIPTADAGGFGYVWQRGRGMVEVATLPTRLLPARCNIRHHCSQPLVERWLAYRMGSTSLAGFGNTSNLLDEVSPTVRRRLEALLGADDSPE